MKIIDLRRYYYPIYTKQTLMEVPDEVADALEEAWHIEHRQESSKTYHGVLSLDANDGVENYVLFHALSPEEALLAAEDEAEQAVVLDRLREAMKRLTAIQTRRIRARYVLGMKMREIAEADGVSVSNASSTVRDGIKKLRKIFRKNKWLDKPTEGQRQDDKQDKLGKK